MASIVINGEDYRRLLRDVQQLQGYLTDEAPRIVVSTVAIVGRRNADRRVAGVLNLGKVVGKYRKNGGGWIWDERQYSALNSLGAWSSTTRKAKDGSLWMLSRYSWETAKWKSGRPFAKAGFTSTLANLWDGPTKVYDRSSPVFRSGSGNFGRIKAGTSRNGLGIWRYYVQGLGAAEDDAVARAEKHMLNRGLVE